MAQDEKDKSLPSLAKELAKSEVDSKSLKLEGVDLIKHFALSHFSTAAVRDAPRTRFRVAGARRPRPRAVPRAAGPIASNASIDSRTPKTALAFGQDCGLLVLLQDARSLPEKVDSEEDALPKKKKAKQAKRRSKLYRRATAEELKANSNAEEERKRLQVRAACFA